MQYTVALLASLAAAVTAQGVTSAISPKASSPAGCMSSYSGTFEIETVNVTSSSKRSLEARQASPLIISLSNGKLTDDKGRTGYIAANNQFQFDSPPQTGAIYTAGWSVCSNGTLAIGGTAIFQQCLSGGFYNLYLNNTADQCSSIYIDIIPTSASASGGASQLSDGQIQATPLPLCQISDGQIQATSCVSAAKVSQISDGQIQATTAASAAAVVTQISDGQIQATTAATMKTSAANVVSQISDGQIQATSAKPASYTGSSTRSAVAYTGAAVTAGLRGEVFGLAAGVLAAALI